MQVEVFAAFKMSNTLTIINRRAAYCAVHIITFLKQELCKILTILSCYTRDKGYLSILHIYIIVIYFYTFILPKINHFKSMYLYI